MDFSRKYYKYRAAGQSISPDFIQKIKSGLDTVERHSKIEIETVLEHIPVEELHSRAEQLFKEYQCVKSNSPLDSKVQQSDKEAPVKPIQKTYEDALVKALAEWFKKWFKWVDTLPCPNCSKKTQHAGSAVPTQEDLQYGANRVEIHECIDCKLKVRFPRYNSVEKLLETRMGRCGEFANTFCMILKAMSFTTRYILDFTDHVWVEYLSNGVWVHVDPCEDIVGEKLLYEKGWGKKLNYVIGFWEKGVKDVTGNYTADFEQCRTRRLLGSEYKVIEYCDSITETLRKGLSDTEKIALDKLDIKEFQVKEQQWGVVGPRQSGSLEWKLSRGEMGK